MGSEHVHRSKANSGAVLAGKILGAIAPGGGAPINFLTTPFFPKKMPFLSTETGPL